MLLSSLRTRLSRTVRQNDLYWRYGANWKPWLAHQFRPMRLNATQKRLLGDLKRDGIVITTVEELLGKNTLLDELEATVWKLESTLADEISARRKRVDEPGVKNYLVELLGSCPALNPDSIFVRFALQPVVLGLANAYLRMYSRLSFFNVWHNLPSRGPARNAQLWPRDLDDRRIFKLFIYFTDVGEGDGPLIYAPSTHADGSVKRTPETFGEEGTSARRSNDVQMNAVVPKEKWIAATGPRGTAILVDTRGYHKGGYVREHDRVVYTCMFTSQAATLRGKYFQRMTPMPAVSDPVVAFALGGEL